MKKILFLLAAILSISFVFAVGIYKTGGAAETAGRKPVRFTLETETTPAQQLRARIRIADAASGDVVYEDAIRLTRNGAAYKSDLVFLLPGEYQLDSIYPVREEKEVMSTGVQDLALKHAAFFVY